MSRLTLTLTTDQFDGLHRELDKTRRNSDTVRVSRDALDKLLLDHGRLCALFRGQIQEVVS